MKRATHEIAGEIATGEGREISTEEATGYVVMENLPAANRPRETSTGGQTGPGGISQVSAEEATGFVSMEDVSGGASGMSSGGMSSGGLSSGGLSSDGLTRSVGAEVADAHASRLDRGTGVGRFVVLEVLGEGGMGVVYKAYDPTLRREVALKLLQSKSLGEDVEARLVREAQAMAQLSHPNVVAVYDVAVEGGQVVLAMEYVAGQTLRDWITKPPQDVRRSWMEVLAALRQAGQGLAAAHKVGLVHRDFKPANVLVSEEGQVKVTDFGIAKEVGKGRQTMGEVDEAAFVEEVDATLTHANAVVGTPRYMAPEQHLRQEIDPRTDQYAFCVAVWEALCGAPPFVYGDQGVTGLQAAKLAGPPDWPKNTGVPRIIVDAVRRGLAPKPEDRWPTMPMLLDVLGYDPSARRRKWAAGAVAVPALAVSGGWLWAWQAERAQLCAGAQEQLSGVWDDGRRQEVEGVVLATNLPYASETWARVEASLDGYADAWVTQHQAACEATALRAEQSKEVLDMRMACLHRAQVELKSVVDVLGQADAQVVEHGVDMAAGLPSLMRCADVEALRAAVPPPEAAEDADKVEKARDALAMATALQHASKYENAFESVMSAAALIEGLEYEPIKAEIDYRRGLVLQHQGEYEKSEEALELALQIALKNKITALASKTAAALATVVSEHRGRPAEGIWVGKVAAGLGVRSGMADIEAEARIGLATALFGKAQYKEAEDETKRAYELYEKAFGPEHVEVAQARTEFAAALSKQGRHEEAEAEYRRAVALFEKILGENHPRVATARDELAAALFEAGRHDDAQVEYRRAVELREKVLQPDHPEFASTYDNLVRSQMQLERYVEAEAEVRKAIAMYEGKLGPDHVALATSFHNLGDVFIAQGRSAEAEKELRRALEMRIAALGAEHLQVAETHALLGRALASQGRQPEAETEQRRALELYTKRFGSEHATVAAATLSVGQSLAQQGRHQEAEAEVRKALALFEKNGGAEHVRTAEARMELGSVLGALGRHVDAEKELRAALEHLQKVQSDSPNAATAAHALAVALLAQNKAADALPFLEQAWTIRSKAGTLQQRATTAFELAKVLWTTPAERTRASELAKVASAALTELGDAAGDRRTEVERWMAKHR